MDNGPWCRNRCGQQCVSKLIHKEQVVGEGSGCCPFGATFSLDGLEARLGRTLELGHLGAFDLFGFVSPQNRGVGARLELRPLDDFGLFMEGQYSGRRDYGVHGGLRWRF